ncbi:uncharacterized protein LOC109596446 [Aethina tumida]|uniref:uncharacterized protein LOC109596446 n=1 Tax=Aethina tumida TaxID=116153 RepID=UPI00096ADA84|nr:uncharacterized protein LOC109596446 [Aethina tumida]
MEWQSNEQNAPGKPKDDANWRKEFDTYFQFIESLQVLLTVRRKLEMQLDDLKSEAIFNIMNTTYETAIDNISKEISNFQDTIVDLDEIHKFKTRLRNMEFKTALQRIPLLRKLNSDIKYYEGKLENNVGRAEESLNNQVSFFKQKLSDLLKQLCHTIIEDKIVFLELKEHYRVLVEKYCELENQAVEQHASFDLFKNLVVNEAIAFRKQKRIPETHFDEPSAMELDGEKDDDEKEADWKIGRLEKRRLNQQLEYNNQKKPKLETPTETSTPLVLDKIPEKDPWMMPKNPETPKTPSYKTAERHIDQIMTFNPSDPDYIVE